MTTRRSSLSADRVRRAWLMATPMLLILLLVAGWPLGRTIWLSFTDVQLSNLDEWNFVGLENYVGEYGLLADPEWWGAVGNTLVFAGLSVTLETLLGLGVALLLNHPSRLRTLLRASMLIPWAIPTVVSAKMWSWMLHDQFGVVNHYLMSWGLMSTPIAWTADPDLALFTIVLVDVWKTTPFMALLILAALQMVPADCYEAARVDGVPPFTVFRKVTLPLILPGVAVAMIFRMLDSMRVFDLIYVMTSNSRSTKSMSVFVREQLIDFQLVGYGSAAATVVFFTISLMTILYMGLLRPALQKVEA
ncbi:sugar ABC transporter permease [Schlegelella sp. S2-27]|uniref:Sugar ABC transporter permease n=1 Tax=Caldimonas mangrovi TaxID=2944811 RepID=A0ABT0YMN4_9BURK|nr:sugar ABC transporter permease [Caldimonas mangrovi]MCM5679988.1 sugar ABC transporter permease [Caldimonas mangrovi]